MRVGTLMQAAVVVVAAFWGASAFAAAPGRGAAVVPPLPADAPGRDGYWGIWQTTDPKVVGTRLSLNLITHAPMMNSGMHYAEACTVYGSLRFLQATGDKATLDKVMAKYATLLTPEGQQRLVPVPDHVDHSVFGIVPFEMYKVTKNNVYLEMGKKCADAQWTPPANPTPANKVLLDAGLTTQTRWWIDDMFMIIGLQMQAYRMTGDKTYMNHAAHEMVAYLDKLQQPNGLFFHGDDAKFFWGRGDGWVAVGMAEVLMDLPADHPDRARIMEGYKKMMAGLLANQGEDGMWHQLIDHPESWPESSSTGMFTFAFGVGVRKGWLAEGDYKPAAKKAWSALCGYIDDNASVREVCEGTGKGTTVQYYLARRRNVGDFHGQAGAIWAAWAMAADLKP